MREQIRGATLGAIRTARRSAAMVSDLTGSVLRRLERLNGGSPQPEDVARVVSEELRETLAGQALPPGEGRETDDEREELRRRFQWLLERSQDPEPPHGVHPALLRIVEQISADEARIIRLFHEEGAQPVVHVLATPKLGFGSRTILENLSLVGDRAGCHRTELAPTYLDNLHRLGVLKVSDEELVGHEDYELIESRPEYEEAAEHIREELQQRPKSERGSVRLTALGQRFCEVSLGSS
jgi:hypothetical protein